jgi:uncharacterized protein (UPF0333 family)
MKICFAKVKNADANVEGYNRNRRLQSANQVGYPELKRIKNFFDSHKGNPQDAPFILNGENKMKDFVNSILSGARQSLSTSKEIRNNTGMDGSKPELADPNVNLNISQDTANKSTIEKYDLQVTESLKRINDLITKLL